MTTASRIAVGQAAARLGLSTQAVRDLARASKLDAAKDQSGRWFFDAESVERYLAEHGSRKRTWQAEIDELRSELRRLTGLVDTLSASQSEPRLREIERERDSSRADAATVRAATLLLVASTTEGIVALQAAASSMRKQSDALAQLLAPKSARDLLP